MHLTDEITNRTDAVSSQKQLLQKQTKSVWCFEEPCFYWFPPCIIVFFERSLYFLGKIVVFVRTEYREYLFLEKTALAVIGWEHILGLPLHKAANADDDQWEQNICLNVSELWHFLFQRNIKRWDDEALLNTTEESRDWILIKLTPRAAGRDKTILLNFVSPFLNSILLTRQYFKSKIFDFKFNSIGPQRTQNLKFLIWKTNMLDSTLKNLKRQTQHSNLIDVGYKTTFILFSSFKIMFAMKNIDWIGISCRYKEMNVSLLEKKSPRLILPIFPICSFQIVSRTFHIAQSHKMIGTLVIRNIRGSPCIQIRICQICRQNYRSCRNQRKIKFANKKINFAAAFLSPDHGRAIYALIAVSPLLCVSLIMIAINLLMSVLTWLFLW